jgi:hypothetical protein
MSKSGKSADILMHVESLVFQVVVLDVLQANDVKHWPIPLRIVGICHDDERPILCSKLMLEIQKSKGKLVLFFLLACCSKRSVIST